MVNSSGSHVRIGNFLAMKKRLHPDRTFMMSSELVKKDSSNPAMHLSRYQGMAHVRRSVQSEKKESTKKLRQVEETSAQLSRLFHSWFADNPLLMMAYDRDSLAILAVNEAAVRHYEYSREEFLAMTIAICEGRFCRERSERSRFCRGCEGRRS